MEEIGFLLGLDKSSLLANQKRFVGNAKNLETKKTLVLLLVKTIIFVQSAGLKESKKGILNVFRVYATTSQLKSLY